jgi:hypothetical protein
MGSGDDTIILERMDLAAKTWPSLPLRCGEEVVQEERPSMLFQRWQRDAARRGYTSPSFSYPFIPPGKAEGGHGQRRFVFDRVRELFSSFIRQKSRHF